MHPGPDRIYIIGGNLQVVYYLTKMASRVLKNLLLQAVQKGLDARHREDLAAERTLEVREQREPMRNAADEPSCDL
jgi:hypothetical protein